MKGITVCVEFDDLLAITLPHNLHHFKEFLVVTTPDDYATHAVARRHNVGIFMTEAFYDSHAIFNKWKALEQGLDAIGREGWMAIMDVDVLWPRSIPSDYDKKGLYTPRRKVWTNLSLDPPAEEHWHSLRTYPEVEWAGYTQIFHCDSPFLCKPPWHETDWIHAGGADSAFQNLWPAAHKHRPQWQCLHLGAPGHNWCGRVSPRINGERSKKAADRAKALQQIFALRGVTGGYAHERITAQNI